MSGSLAENNTRHDAFFLRGTIMDCAPGGSFVDDRLRMQGDGAILVRDGRIEAVGPADELLAAQGRQLPVHDYRGCLITPGFVDSHLHLPQTDIIASYGERLLSWLEHYAFPCEARFADATTAAETAAFFADELCRNGTTTALVMGSVHAVSCEAMFEAAQSRGLRLIAGKMLMDRNCPASVRENAAAGYRASRELIERWHGVDRLAYAITPRFAPTSSDQQLRLAAQLASAFPDVYIHSHLAENQQELAWVSKLFPSARSYLDVYDSYGLLRERATYAHCIYLDDDDRRRMAEAGASIAFAPTSNLFLGSGLLDYTRARAAGIPIGLATDIGGGTSFSMLRTAAAAYEVAALMGQPLPGRTLLYLATRAGAEALALDDVVGSIEVGKEADLAVLDPAATPLLARRTASAPWEDVLFALFILGDERAVSATYSLGTVVHPRSGKTPSGHGSRI